MKHKIYGIKSEWIEGGQVPVKTFEWYFECGLCYTVKAAHANMIYVEAEGHVVQNHKVDGLALVG